jgi:hypothetical protein
MSKNDKTTQREEVEATLQPIAFHVPEPGSTAGAIVLLVGSGAMSALSGYAAAESDGDERDFLLAVALIVALVAIAVPIWIVRRSRRHGEMVIDPVRGEIRIARSYEIPFSSVRRIDVVDHEYTYRAINSSHDAVSADMKGWAIDIGGGHYLCGQSCLSREKVTEIANALRIRVEAYRARTNEGVAPLPRPDPGLLELMAGVLREEGKEFQEDWLSPDGPMAEWMRSYEDSEPDEQTMGPDGDFAKALRKVGYEFGNTTDSPPTLAGQPTTPRGRSASDT